MFEFPRAWKYSIRQRGMAKRKNRPGERSRAIILFANFYPRGTLYVGSCTEPCIARHMCTWHLLAQETTAPGKRDVSRERRYDTYKLQSPRRVHPFTRSSPVTFALVRYVIETPIRWRCKDRFLNAWKIANRFGAHVRRSRKRLVFWLEKRREKRRCETVGSKRFFESQSSRAATFEHTFMPAIFLLPRACQFVTVLCR